MLRIKMNARHNFPRVLYSGKVLKISRDLRSQKILIETGIRQSLSNNSNNFTWYFDINYSIL